MDHTSGPHGASGPPPAPSSSSSPSPLPSSLPSSDPLDLERRPGGDLPDGVDPLGVPTERSDHNAFVLLAAVVVALLALIFTLSWVVYHQMSPSGGDGQQRQQPTRSAPTTPVIPTLT